MSTRPSCSASSARRRTRIRDLVFLRCGDGPSVELFEYSGEDSAARPKRVSEVGGMVFFFEVDDVFASAKRLGAKGIELLDGPNTVEEGPLAGFSWIYFNTPWGRIWKSPAFPRSATKGTQRNACGGRSHNGSEVWRKPWAAGQTSTMPPSDMMTCPVI